MNPHRRISAAEALQHPYFTAPGGPPPPPPHTCVAPAAAAGGGGSGGGTTAGCCDGGGDSRRRTEWRLQMRGSGPGGGRWGSGGQAAAVVVSRIVSELEAPVLSVHSRHSRFAPLLTASCASHRHHHLLLDAHSACRPSHWLPATSWRCATPTTRRARRRLRAEVVTAASERRRRRRLPRSRLASCRLRASASSVQATAARQLRSSTGRRRTPSGAPYTRSRAAQQRPLATPVRRRCRSGQSRLRRRTAVARHRWCRRLRRQPAAACGWVPRAAPAAC